MPAIETVPVPLYQPLDPYDHIHDNLPINGLIEQMFLVNNQVDNNTAILAQSIGTQGTLANRLAQSINDDGSLKTIAIDNALHDISQHLDDGGYVRMTLDERTKLSFISPGATSLSLNVETISGTLAFANTTLIVEPSDSITWSFDGHALAAETNFPPSVRHTHYYALMPKTSDYINFTTTTVNTAYQQGSLRVYVNGIRLNDNNFVYVPIGFPVTTWTSLTFTEGTAASGIVTGGDFRLSSTIPSSASIIVDFDVLYSP